MENLMHGFRKPNILDMKLGTVLYDEDALPDKKERMQNAARRTTSGETGVCLTGFQVRTGPLIRWTDLGTGERQHYCRSLTIKRHNPSSFRKHMGNLSNPRSFRKVLHDSSLSADR